ncbi:MAG: DUF3019 domain-containing protein [Pseudomonadota bacterium]
MQNILILSPSKCIAISEGRDCYADIQISWTLDAAKDVCLFSDLESTPLKCWNSKASAKETFELVSNSSIHFRLLDTNNDELLAESTLKVTWIYKKQQRKRRWRVF